MKSTFHHLIDYVSMARIPAIHKDSKTHSALVTTRIKNENMTDFIL